MISGQVPVCYVLIGLPGTGKSTWINTHFKTAVTPTHVASSDNIAERLALESDVSYSEIIRTRFKEVDREYKDSLFAAIRENKDIIVDRTNLSFKARERVRTYLRSHTGTKYYTKGLLFEAPLDVIRERLENRYRETGKLVGWDIVETMIPTYAEPSVHEFDALIRMNP